MAWTEERVEKLKKLWEEGRSASEIAKELGSVTRNAVIGKVHRMGLQARATSSDSSKSANAAKAEKTAKKAKAAPKEKVEVVVEKVVEVKAKVEVETEAEADAKPGTENQFPSVVPVNNDEVSEETRRNVERIESQSRQLNLMQLTERTCKWPIGDPATEEFWFCGHASEPGKPYCQAHVELAFQAPMSRRDRR